jgi:preprotein translocase subunit SecF
MSAVLSRASGLWSRLYRGETAFNFIGHWRRWFAISAVVILVGVIALLVRGLAFGIDFAGGTSWQVQTAKVTVAQARTALTPLGLGQATIETLGRGGSRTLEVQDKVTGSAAQQAAVKNEVTGKLAKLAGVNPSRITIEDVGPTWGGEITHKAVVAVIVFFVVIFAYISLRFEWKMAVAAILAVIHDIAVTVGIYALVGFQVTPETVVGVLTILGYSLYDTIVVFDRVKENVRGLGATGRLTYADTVNLSMNQVFMRSVNTSIVAVLPVLSVLVIGAQLLGATTLQDFGLALVIGLTSGAYSSIFIASPILVLLKEREPRYAAIRQRLSARGETVTLLTPAAAATSIGAAGGRAGRGGPSIRRPRAGRPQDGRVVAVREPEAAPAPAPAPGTPPGPGDGASGGSSRPLLTPGGRPAAGRPAASSPAQPRPRGGAARTPPRPRKKRRRR